MKKLSSAVENKLLTALEKTATYINDGLAPSQAVAKAAMDQGVGPGYVSVMVHAYNTGRTTRQRQDGTTPLEKSADFQLADAAEVLEIMYPSQVKTAAAHRQSTEVSTEYAYSPTGLLTRRSSREKAAQQHDWGLGRPAPAPYPRDPRFVMKRAVSEVDRLKRAVEEKRAKVTLAFDKMGQTFMEITDYFRRPDARPIPIVREHVMLLHGDKGEQIMDELVQVTPALTKLANHRTGQSLLGPRGRSTFAGQDEPADGQPYDLINRLVGEIDSYKQLKTAYQNAAEESVQQAEVLLGPFVHRGVSPSILGPSSDKRAFMDPMKALGAMGLLEKTITGIASGMKGPDEDKLVQKNLQSLTDPEHESRLRNISTQAMLQEMMTSDPVISGYDPNEVTDAFNDLVQVAPHSADQRMLMQSLLRKRLQHGSIDPFEVDQLMGMENKLQQRSQLKGVGADGSVL